MVFRLPVINVDGEVGDLSNVGSSLFKPSGEVLPPSLIKKLGVRGAQKAPTKDVESAAAILRLLVCGSAGGERALLAGLLRQSERRGDLPRPHGAAPEYGFWRAGRHYCAVGAADYRQYARELAGPAAARAAVIVLDAGAGLDIDARRHSRIVAMLGVRHVILAVDHGDLAGCDSAAFERLALAYRAFVADFGFASVQAIPVSAASGDNLIESSALTPWYAGPSLMAQLDALDAAQPGPTALAPGEAPAAADAPPEVADQFEAKLLWLAAHPLAAGRQYRLSWHGRDVTATLTRIKYREDVDSGAHLAASTVGQHDIAVVNLSLSEPVAFAPDRAGFVLRDKLGEDIVGAGLIVFALRRASNIHWQALELNQHARAAQMRQRPRCIWLTGLSGSGKSTLANLLEKRLYGAGRHTYLLDGDNVRHGLNRDLGFTEADRVENVRRVAEVAKLMVDAGLIVLVSFISPFRAERRMARALFADGEFVEVFVDTPLAECERRDVKGLYAKARRGELKNFTGIDSDYEAPEAPEVRLRPDRDSVEVCVDTLLLALE